MIVCCPHSRSAGRYFSFLAKLYRKRFAKRGFEPSQKQLLKGLESVGYHNADLLEIGCGVGHLHQTLLERGASSAVAVDLAPQMLKQARDWAIQRGLANRTVYLEGDFIDLQHDIAPVDVTLMDKVVCCYPDAKALVCGSLRKTGEVYALIYPRDRWFVKLMIEMGAMFFLLIRSCFRPYAHDPEQIEAWIRNEGFRKQYENTTAVWLTQIYTKA